MTTRYEFIDGIWQIVLEDSDALAVEAEINRLNGSNRFMFIGPHKTGDKYMAKGMLLFAAAGWC